LDEAVESVTPSLHGKPDNELEIQPETKNAFGSAPQVHNRCRQILEACGRPGSIWQWALSGFCRKKSLGQWSQWDALQRVAGYLIGGAPESPAQAGHPCSGLQSILVKAKIFFITSLINCKEKGVLQVFASARARSFKII